MKINCSYKKGDYCSYRDRKCNPKSAGCKKNWKPSMNSLAPPVPVSSLPRIRNTKETDPLTDYPELRKIDLIYEIPTLYVYGGHLHESREDLEDVCVLCDLMGSSKIKGYLCAYSKKTDKYYIAISHIKYYAKVRKCPNAILKYATSWECTEPANQIDGFNENSLLSLYGYHVGKTNGLPKKQRQVIIKHLIDKNIMTRYEITGLLQSFVELRRGREDVDYSACISDWEDDIQFIRAYGTDFD